MQTPEGKLIADAQKRLNISSRKAAAQVGMSDTRWRNVVNGYQAVGRGDQIKITAPADTLARMASVVGVTPEQLIEVGREDAANVYGDMFDPKLELGRLIREQLAEFGMGPETFTKRLSEQNRRPFYSWMAGTNAPQAKNRPVLEDALTWERGAITRILEAPITERITLAEVRDWAVVGEDPAPVRRASELSTDALLIELTRRSGAMEARIAELEAENEALKQPGNVVPFERGQPRNLFGLAAENTEAGREDLEDD